MKAALHNGAIRFFPAMIVAVWFVLTAHAEDARTVLNKYKASYEQELAGIESQCEKTKTNWPAQYLSLLKSIEQKMQQAGDLDSVLVARQEQERFGKDSNIPDEALVEKPVELRNAQLRGRKAQENVDVDRCKRIVVLADKYVAGLENLKRNLTVQGKVEDAIATKAEIDAVRTRPEVTAAQFTLAAAGIDLRPAEQPSAGNPPQPPPAEKTKTGLPQDLSKGLVLYYSFNKNENGKVTDESGKKNDGKVRGAKWIPKGKVGGAYSLDGKSDYISATGFKGVLGASAMSVAVWAKSDSYYHGGTCIAHWGDGSAWGGMFYVGYNGAGDHGIYGTVGGWDIFGGNAPQGDGRWHHVALVTDGDEVSLYVDGEFANSARTSHRINVKRKNDVSIGQSGGSGYLNGAIDEVMIFERALSADEVKQIYNAKK